MILSPPSFRKRYKSPYETSSSSSSLTLPSRKRYRGTSELIADTKTECDESEDEGTDSKSEEAASEDQQQAVSAEDTTEDEPSGLGYRAARRRTLELAEGTVPSTYEVGQSSRSTPDQHIAYETPTPGLPPISDTPIIPSLVASPVPAAAVDEDDFLEIGAQLELHGSILHDHTERLDALPPTLFEGYGQDFTELLLGHLDAERAALWNARYEDQREIHDLRMQRAADQRELQELRELVATLEQRFGH
ncbi:hypothetical protein Tco_0861262 [Tanacetum coccineum]|uniref:Uncharacterized protein n=1 Tax=Tanacetum coccineum TaxID=301880 RepID=A0ABQ5BHB2_9ASTR